MKPFIKKYAIELVTAGVILIGVFLMVERFEIRATLLAALSLAINGILSVVKYILGRVSNRVEELSASDALGMLLILLAGAIIVWRIRFRFRTDKRWETDTCPKCSGPIMRVHRSVWDRVLEVIILPDARRYRCMNPHQCGWSGLRRQHIIHRRQHSEPVSGSEDH